MITESTLLAQSRGRGGKIHSCMLGVFLFSLMIRLVNEQAWDLNLKSKIVSINNLAKFLGNYNL